MNQEQYKFYKSQFELLNDPNFSGQNPPKDFYLGSAVFWDSIRKIKAKRNIKRTKDTTSYYSRRKRLSSSIKNRNSSLERTIKRTK